MAVDDFGFWHSLRRIRSPNSCVCILSWCSPLINYSWNNSFSIWYCASLRTQSLYFVPKWGINGGRWQLFQESLWTFCLFWSFGIVLNQCYKSWKTRSMSIITQVHIKALFHLWSFFSLLSFLFICCHGALMPRYAAMYFVFVQTVIVAFSSSIHRSANMLQQPKKSGKNSASYGLRHFTHQPSE